MNKVVDERLVPNGEYVDALNIRMGSTENAEIGVIENSKGNEQLTTLSYIDGTPLSADALCIGALDDTANDTIYWFVHDPNFTVGATGKLDLIVSYNTNSTILLYHVISIDDGGGVNTTLNFNPRYTITGVNLVDNLLFFTDDYNQPRFINVRRNYANPVLNIDYGGGAGPGILREALHVIKKPPVNAPPIQPYKTAGQENFMDIRFISFAYRYRYVDGEYSATSQWSPVSFLPNDFQFSTSSWLNDGMVNATNAATITYNSGGPLVVGIDLLFKEGDSNIIKVIEKLDKASLGLSDNVNYNYQFDNSKIFTILPESELLRLYDNVPRLAKAQTVMGNRLLYGNYLEGYDMVDQNGNPVNIDYQANLISNNLNQQTINAAYISSNYSINGALTVPLSKIEIDLQGIQLTAGALLTIDLRFINTQWSGTAPFPSTANSTGDTTVSLSFLLPVSYSSVFQMVTSQEFQSAIGEFLNPPVTTGNALPVWSPVIGQPTSCNGSTLTDQVYCNVNANFAGIGTFNKWNGGINGINEGCAATAFPGNDKLYIQLPVMVYVDNLNTPGIYKYEYYRFINSDIRFQTVGSPRSLHSNRGYEVGIVYMDEYSRSTTTLVSQNNTVHVPCGSAPLQNKIQVTIPPSQRAPAWATKYKFVCKADVDTYETVYTNLWFSDPTNAAYAWFLIDGENARKVEVGDRLIVKSDTSGQLNDCTFTTVLDKKAFAAGDLVTSNPEGVYMKLNANDFSIATVPGAVVSRSGSGTFSSAATPIIRIYMNTGTLTTPNNLNVDIPAGSRIVINAKWQRVGTGNLCEKREYTFNKTYIATTNYNDLKQWFDLDGIASTINSGTAVVSPSGNCPIQNIYNSALLPTGNLTQTNLCINYWQFENGGLDANGDPRVILQLSGTYGCSSFANLGSSKRDSKINATITVYRAVNLIVFETMPKDTIPDIFYENHLSFDINTSTGEHLGNVQNQSIAGGVPAIIDTEFFNCFTFGNGVESYKVRDSAIGKQFNLGQRVTSVSAQDYKASERYADITYSGIYNNESNVNKLKEFNLGLVNFKALEDSFGRIFRLDGRETDVLVLQEDKISYVLAGKNLLSDAAAGGAITSVPEVLGTQIARVEKYGISFHPESYVHWGYDRYFTDAKRGAVLQLKGNSYNNDQLRVVSEQGMRTWFRDVFNDSFLTQKLGGFDPYMNEYVLCSNDRPIPLNPSCIDCGFSTTFILSGTQIKDIAEEYCVDLGNGIGTVDVSWVINSPNPIPPGTFYEIKIFYNNVLAISSNTINTPSGTLTFQKNLGNVDTARIEIYVVGSITITMTVDCPTLQPMNIVEVVLTSDFESGQTIHTEYRYTQGAYLSPVQQNLVTFASGVTNPLVSRYNISSWFAGSPSFPSDNSTMFIQTNKIVPDTFNFDLLNDRLRWYRSTTLYANTSGDLLTLLGLSSNLTVSNAGSVFFGSFTVPVGAPNDYLYLIWDFRDSVGNQLCYNTTEESACCDCETCDFDNECIRIGVSNFDPVNLAAISLPNGVCGDPTPVSYTVQPLTTDYYCVNYPVEIVLGNPVITILECGCIPCESGCSMWRIENVTSPTLQFEYFDCGNNRQFGSLLQGDVYVLCGRTNNPPIITDGSADIVFHRCDCCVAQCFNVRIDLEPAYNTGVITGIIINGEPYYPTFPIDMLDTESLTNFFNSLPTDCTPIGQITSSYNDTGQWVDITFNYTCCQIDALLAIQDGGGEAGYIASLVDCDPTYCCT